MGVAVTVGDESCESTSQGALDNGGSSTHHRLDLSLRSIATKRSPSSPPRMSDNIMSRGRTERKESVKPLKIIACFGHQMLPKARLVMSVSRNTRPVSFLSTRTLILSC